MILVFAFLTRVGWVSKTFEECSLVSEFGGVVWESKGNEKSKQACMVAITCLGFGRVFDGRT